MHFYSKLQLTLTRFITTPLLLMDLLLTAGLPWPTILYTILMDWVMIITGLVGALVVSNYKVCHPTHVHWNIAYSP